MPTLNAGETWYDEADGSLRESQYTFRKLTADSTIGELLAEFEANEIPLESFERGN